MYGHNRHSPIDDDLAREDVEIASEVDDVVEHGARVAPTGGKTERAVEGVVDAEVADGTRRSAGNDRLEPRGVQEGAATRPSAGRRNPVGATKDEDAGLQDLCVAARAYQRAAARLG